MATFDEECERLGRLIGRMIEEDICGAFDNKHPARVVSWDIWSDDGEHFDGEVLLPVLAQHGGTGDDPDRLSSVRSYSALRLSESFDQKLLAGWDFGHPGGGHTDFNNLIKRGFSG